MSPARARQVALSRPFGRTKLPNPPKTLDEGPIPRRQRTLTIQLMSSGLKLIAVVDDEQAVRTALTRLLRSAGFAAEAYLSGADFLESLATRIPDCVLLDLWMPAMSGHEVQARLAAAGRHVPVVVLTGHASADARERALEAGAVAFLLKPADDSELLAVIVTATGG